MYVVGQIQVAVSDPVWKSQIYVGRLRVPFKEHRFEM